MRAKRHACNVFIRKPESKRAHGRPKCKWEDNLKWMLKSMGEF
jgi:hypothetical protein